MLRDVDTEQFFLPAQLLRLRDLRFVELQRWQRRRYAVAEHVEHRRLARLLELRFSLSERDDAVDVVEQRAAVAERVERAGLDERLVDALVQRPRIDALREIFDARE